MKWYIINKKYVDYLQKFDNKIENINYNNSLKPYIGIIFQINNLDYYVPISSVKKKYYNMKENIDFIKVDTINNSTYKIYGALNLNNMIPVFDKDRTLLNYNDLSKYIAFKTPAEKYNYISLLQKELSIINSKTVQILQSANVLYNYKKQKPYTSIAKRTVDFDIIENKSIEWNIVQDTLPILNYIKNENDLFYIYDCLVNKEDFEDIVCKLDNPTNSLNIQNMNEYDINHYLSRSIDNDVILKK